MRARVLSLLALTSLGCDQNPIRPPGSAGPMLNWGPGSTALFDPSAMSPSIVGDWFKCCTFPGVDDCGTLTTEGIRFDATGRYAALHGDIVCFPDPSRAAWSTEDDCAKGRYANDGETIALTPDDGSASVSVAYTLLGDVMTASVAGAPPLILARIQVDSTLRSNPCDEVDPSGIRCCGILRPF